MKHGLMAAELFVQGYNCAQAIAVAFCDVTGMEKDAAAKMASSFGGGMGGLREVCGAVSGMLVVAGMLYGSDTLEDVQNKEHYQRVQELAGAFRERVGSIICREILGNLPTDPDLDPQMEAYYRARPCALMVYAAAEILDAYISEHPLN